MLTTIVLPANYNLQFAQESLLPDGIQSSEGYSAGGWIGHRSKVSSADISADEEEHVNGRSLRSVRFFRKARSRSRLGRSASPPSPVS